MHWRKEAEGSVDLEPHHRTLVIISSIVPLSPSDAVAISTIRVSSGFDSKRIGLSYTAH